jgi:acyl-CoA hydrolase
MLLVAAWPKRSMLRLYNVFIPQSKTLDTHPLCDFPIPATLEHMESLDGHKHPRPVSESISEMAEVVLPNDANPLNNLLGGRLMHFIDIAGAMAAHRHSRSYVVTASMDHIDFLAPVHVGDLLILRSSVNRAFHTSMEVGVKCWVENYIAGTRRHIASAYLTFVAVDNRGRRLPVPPVIPETEEEKQRYEDAGRRRELRKQEQERKRANQLARQ